MKVVLGLKASPTHDTGASLLVEREGGIEVVAISQERITRQKHARTFPQEAIDYCLEAFGLSLADVSLVVSDFIWQPSVRDAFAGLQPPDLDRKKAFYTQLAQASIPYVFVDHHLCHAASAFYGTPWDDAVGVVIDGLGSRLETQSLYQCARGGLTKLAYSYKAGIGIMYSAVTESLLGFAHLQEGKTMGLAGWTNTGKEYGKLFQANSDDQPIHAHYPQFREETTNREYWNLVAPADLPRREADQDPTSSPFVNYAYAAQQEMEKRVMAVMHQAKRLTGNRRLAYAGGVALNILVNRLILDSGLFDEVFVQPAASDAGIPLGASLLGYYSILGGQKRWEMDHAFLAKPYDQQQLDTALGNWSGPQTQYDQATLAKVLNNDYLIAWFQGASEFGPRALGHRSILCSPRHPNMKAFLNGEVKYREMFRPFAPIVPVERQAEFFDLATPSPYMLINAKVHDEYQAKIPAIVHADGTARVQSVQQSTNAELHGLLNEFGQQNGIPVLLNTSLNLAGEPIVETPGDVVDLFSRARLDVLVMGNHLLSKRPIEEYLQTRNPGPDQVENYDPRATRKQAA